MKKLWYLILIINIIPISIIGQKAYYSTYVATYWGEKIIDGGNLLNARLCRVQKGQKIEQFSPYQVQEYGFNDGRVYVSREIQIGDSTKRVFLEHLVKGDISLYYYRGKEVKTFFLKKGEGELVELPKQGKVNRKSNFQNQLKEMTSDYYYTTDAAKLVSYNKKSLTKFIEGYNKRDLPLFTFLRFGANVGYGTSKLNVPLELHSDYVGKFDYKYENGFVVGLFVDIPISSNGFSSNIGLHYSSNVYSYNKFIDSVDVDFIANTSSLTIPLFIRYTIPTKKIKPFFNAGGCFSYHLKNESSIYEATFSQNIIEIKDKTEQSYISKNQLGYSIGAGLEYKLTHRNSLFIELRYNKMFGLSADKALGKSVINFITGINF